MESDQESGAGQRPDFSSRLVGGAPPCWVLLALCCCGLALILPGFAGCVRWASRSCCVCVQLVHEASPVYGTPIGSLSGSAAGDWLLRRNGRLLTKRRGDPVIIVPSGRCRTLRHRHFPL